jgi:hypothetical protein
MSFQCGGGSPYAFTHARDGANLPDSECLSRWTYVTSVESEPFKLPRAAADAHKSATTSRPRLFAPPLARRSG